MKGDIRMTEYEMFCQLNDLISDRFSFLSDDTGSSKVFEKDIKALKQVINDYKLFKQYVVTEVHKKGEIFSIWKKENIEKKYIEIIDYCDNGHNDYRCHVKLFINDKQVANVICSFDKIEIYKKIDKIKLENEKYNIESAFKLLIYESFDKFLSLPKLSKCSPLLKEMYELVCVSNNSVCCINKEDRNEVFTRKDYDDLKVEVTKLKLEDIITINEYTIIGCSDLVTWFNNDLELKKERCYEKY